MPTFTFEQDPLSLQNEEQTRFNARDKTESTIFPQWNLIVIWAKVMVVDGEKRVIKKYFEKAIKCIWE